MGQPSELRPRKRIGNAPLDFLRIHRSTIVNVHRIKEIQRWFGGYHLVLLENGKELRMSRYQSEIARRLGLA
jgi:two-component system LytT family response regulator